MFPRDRRNVHVIIKKSLALKSKLLMQGFFFFSEEPDMYLTVKAKFDLGSAVFRLLSIYKMMLRSSNYLQRLVETSNT